MKFKTFVISFLILALSYFVFKIFIKDSHIRWQYKLMHMIFGMVSWTYRSGPVLNRENLDLLGKLGLYKHKPSTNGQFIDGVLIEDVEISSSFGNDKENKFKIKVYVPHTQDLNKKFPVLVNIHGGGFVFDFGSERNIDYAKQGFLVVAVHYRLAPEYKYPTALEDCYSTMIWLHNTENMHIKKYADFSKISLIGDSAGANLVATLPFLLRERKFPLKISHQILIYPTMLTDVITESKQKFKENNTYILTFGLMNWFERQYITEKHLYQDPLVNPLKNENFDLIPSALVILATEDVLYSEGKEYGELMKHKSVPVEVIEYNSVHGFYEFKIGKEDKEAFDKIMEYFKKHKFFN